MKKLILAILLLGYGFCFAQDEALKIHFIDVGRGDAILIQANGAFALVDTGTLLSGYQLVDYLQAHNVKTIRHLIVTHPHADHLSGVFFIAPKFEIENFYDNAGALNTLENALQDWYQKIFRGQKNYRALKEGDTIRLGEVALQVLWPGAGKQEGVNHNSLVIMVIYKDFRCLLSADIDLAAEQQLLLLHADIKADILKVSHHGAREATSLIFLKKVRPKIAIICVDEKSRRGYPEKKVLDMLAAENIRAYRTDKSGTITVSVSSDCRYMVRPER